MKVKTVLCLDIHTRLVDEQVAKQTSVNAKVKFVSLSYGRWDFFQCVCLIRANTHLNCAVLII
jgi:hypothetical protein